MIQSKICIMGNSVPILIQPPRKSETEKTYCEWLQERGFWVKNSSKQSAIISDLYRYMEDECIRWFPDFVILHFGIVECTIRVRSRFLQNYFACNAWKNDVSSNEFIRPMARALRLITKRVYRASLERIIFVLRWGRRWLSPKNFEFITKEVVKILFRDTPARGIILVGILDGKSWLEKEAPGTLASIQEYNDILERCARELPDVSFLDVNELCRKAAPAELTKDGIHFTATGHEMIGNEIEALLKGGREEYNAWEFIEPYKGILRKHANRDKRKIPNET